MLKVTPYDYQKEAIKAGLEKKRLLIGDEPGLGKSLESIGIVDTANAFPALVICPSSLKINWKREFEKFTDRRALVLSDDCKTTWNYHLEMKTFDVCICNYESLRKYFVWDMKSKSCSLSEIVFTPFIKMFKSIIIDESHRLKDPTTQQAKFTKGISVGKPYIILLSGTPVVNCPEDLVSQLSIMDRLKEFGNKSQFIAQYAQGEKRASNLEELSQRLYESCFIRREKKDVLTELPDKTRREIYVDISNRDEYNTAAQDLAQYLREYKSCTEREIKSKMRKEALMKFMTLRSIVSVGKVKVAVDYINSYLDSGLKLIIFCSLHAIVDELKKAFPKAVTVTGRDSSIQKQNAVDAFQNNSETNLIICSIKAAGVGLTLTASSNVVFVEFPWTWADCCQCEDRSHRIGQKQNVTVDYLMGDNTIDTKLYQIINDKKHIANTIVGTVDEIPTSAVYIDELIDAFLT